MSADIPLIYIVDNEIEICELFKDFFNFIGYESVCECDGEKALRDIETIEYDLMFVDLRLNTVTGIDILKKSKKIKPLSEVILVTGYGSEETILQALQEGASSFIQKPISFSEIKIKTEETLAQHRFNVKTHRLNQMIGENNSEFERHLNDLVQLEKLSKFLDLTIDITSLYDSLLTGISNIITADYYTLLFFDEVNKEMIIYPPHHKNPRSLTTIQDEVTRYFEKLSNTTVDDSLQVRILETAAEEKKVRHTREKLSNIYIPILIGNSIRGILCVSSKTFDNEEHIQDLLRIISKRLSGVLTNATLHRDTKLLALTDGLTGLLNRRAFYERLNSEYERFRRYDSYLSLIVADFDNLKTINDSYGHPVGDEVIKKIGDILVDTTRESDVLARYGGDEFIIVLPQTNSENATNMAERIRKNIESYTFEINDITFNCSISIGVATAPVTGIDSSDDLLECSDQALYESKRTGGNKVTVFSK